MTYSQVCAWSHVERGKFHESPPLDVRGHVHMMSTLRWEGGFPKLTERWSFTSYKQEIMPSCG